MAISCWWPPNLITAHKHLSCHCMVDACRKRGFSWGHFREVLVCPSSRPQKGRFEVHARIQERGLSWAKKWSSCVIGLKLSNFLDSIRCMGMLLVRERTLVLATCEACWVWAGKIEIKSRPQRLPIKLINRSYWEFSTCHCPSSAWLHVWVCVSVCVDITLGVRSRHHLLVNGLTNTCTHAEFPVRGAMAG